MKPTILAYLRAEYPAARTAEQIRGDLALQDRVLGDRIARPIAAVVAALEQLAAEKWAKETGGGWVYVPEVPAVKVVQGTMFD